MLKQMGKHCARKWLTIWMVYTLIRTFSILKPTTGKNFKKNLLSLKIQNVLNFGAM